MDAATAPSWGQVVWEQLSFESKVQYLVDGVNAIGLEKLLEMLVTVGSGICSYRRECHHVLHHVVRRMLESADVMSKATQSKFEEWVACLEDLPFLEKRYMTDVLDSFNESSSE